MKKPLEPIIEGLEAIEREYEVPLLHRVTKAVVISTVGALATWAATKSYDKLFLENHATEELDPEFED